MRRSRQRSVLRFAPLEVRREERTALVDADGRGWRALTLSVREFALLVALAERPQRVVSREELFAAAWAGVLRPGDRTVDVYVSKLRTKLEAALPNWRCIHTHVGFGYRFAPEPSQDFHSAATTS